MYVNNVVVPKGEISFHSSYSITYIYLFISYLWFCNAYANTKVRLLKIVKSEKNL